MKDNSLPTPSNPTEMEELERVKFESRAKVQWANSIRQATEIERDFLIKKLKAVGVEITADEWPTDFEKGYNTEVDLLNGQLSTIKAELEEVKLAVNTFLSKGRPHGGYPDGCECEICEQWDTLNKALNP